MSGFICQRALSAPPLLAFNWVFLSMFSSYCPGTFFKLCSFILSFCRSQQDSIVLQARCQRGMIRLEHFLFNGQGSLVERLGLAVLALVMVERRQVVEALCDIGVLWLEHFLSNGQGSLVERLGLGVLALVFVEHRQVSKTTAQGRMLRKSQ